MNTVLEVENLHKTFTKKRRAIHANDGISLKVQAGQVIGLLGHNGAGKTTLVNQIVGLLTPEKGAISLCGIDAIAYPAKARELTSVQAQANVPISGLTPRKAIELVGQMRGGSKSYVDKRTTDLIDALDLGQWATMPSEKVSGGVARLTSFAMAAVMPGKLVVLDEPTNDVDPARRKLLWNQIRLLADHGSAVLLVTHNVTEAQGVVDSLAILDQGRVLSSGTPAELVESEGAWLSLFVESHNGPVAENFELASNREDDPRTHRTRFTVSYTHAAAAVQWATTLRNQGKISLFELRSPSLEQYYIDHVSHTNERTQP